MNKEMSDHAKARLYGLTALVCSFWLGQSIYDTIVANQKLVTVLNIIFYLSMIIVIGYTAYSSYELFKKIKKNKK
ncbi:hypothetical protein ACVRYP_02090 [Streptococcus rifensis]